MLENRDVIRIVSVLLILKETRRLVIENFQFLPILGATPYLTSITRISKGS